MAYYAWPEDVIGDLKDRIDAYRGQLGLAYVTLGEETLIPEFPALFITAGQIDREIHATQQFKVTFHATVIVFHARLDIGHQQRTVEDMEIATAVVEFLHLPKNRRLVDTSGANKLIFSYVHREQPGYLEVGQGPMVVATQLSWAGESVVPFDLS